MKKALFLATLGLCSATLSMADTITATTKAGSNNANNSNDIYGYAIDLSSALTFTLSDNTTLTASELSAEYGTIKLNSIGFSIASAGSTLQLVLYKLPDETGVSSLSGSKLTWGEGAFCGISAETTSVAGSSNGRTVFTFANGGVDIDPTASYAIAFADPIKLTGFDYEAADEMGDWSNHNKVLTFWAQKGGVSGSLYKGGGTSWTNGELPSATYTITATKAPAAIPEPATATLSLLALAGLAARRRRK